MGASHNGDRTGAIRLDHKAAPSDYADYKAAPSDYADYEAAPSDYADYENDERSTSRSGVERSFSTSWSYAGTPSSAESRRTALTMCLGSVTSR